MKSSGAADAAEKPVGTASSAQDAKGPRRGSGSRLLPLVTKYGVILGMILTFAAFSIARPEAFLSTLTIKSLFRDMAPLLVMALGVTVVLIMKDFDLSIGGMLGLCGTMMVILVSSKYAGLPLALALVIGGLLGAALGLINGLLVSVVGASSFIITIAMGTFYQGLDLRILHSRTIFEGIPDIYQQATSGSIAGISSQTLIGLVVFLLMWLLLSKTEVGRHMYFAGGNAEAARLSGIRVRMLRTLGFVIVGVCAGIAGLLISSQAGAANPNSGMGILLPAYAAAFLGTTMWHVGVFTPLGTLLGAFFLQVITTGLSLFNLAGPLVLMIHGAILVVAVVLSCLGQRR